jgi:hypothetical protein
MECSRIELILSEYMEASLPAEEQDRVAEHLQTCSNCSALFHEMQTVVALCHSYPTLDMDPHFVEKILLQTTGRPRTRSIRELFNQYILQPLLTPRFAIGTSLAALFLIIMFDVMMPKLSVSVSSFSPSGLFQFMDRSVQQLYGEGLKIYEKKNAWQAQLDRLKTNALNEVRFMMEQMDVPVEGRKKTEEPPPRKDDSPKQKSSSLYLLSA